MLACRCAALLPLLYEMALMRTVVRRFDKATRLIYEVCKASARALHIPPPRCSDFTYTAVLQTSLHVQPDLHSCFKMKWIVQTSQRTVPHFACQLLNASDTAGKRSGAVERPPW